MEDVPLTPELYCTSIGESLKFYINILGFRVVYDRPEEGFAMLNYQGAKLMLEQIDKSNRIWLTSELEKPFGRGVNFQIKTSDVNMLYDSVIKNGCNIF